MAAVLNWWTCPGDFGFLVRNGHQHAPRVQAAWSQVHSAVLDEVVSIQIIPEVYGSRTEHGLKVEFQKDGGKVRL